MIIKNLELQAITPEYARYLLDKNYENNRTVRHSVVKQYARDMKNGNWVVGLYDNQIAPICISKSGTLLDGQHRLLAIIEANVPVMMFVQTGLSEDAYTVMDNGVKRSTADVMRNSQNAYVLASFLKMVFATKYGESPIASSIQGKLYNRKSSGHVTKHDILEESENADRSTYDECVRNGVSIANAIGRGSPTIFAYGIWLCKWLGVDEELNAYVEGMASTKPSDCINVDLVKTSILKKYLLGGRHTNYDILSVFLKGYDATRNGKRLEKIANVDATMKKFNIYVSAKRSEE